jgi:hypothetical protein
MAEVLRTVNTVSGGDHTTAQAAVDWFTTNYPDFVTSDVQGVIEHAGSNADAGCLYTGITTDATRYLTNVGEGIGSDNKWDSGKYRAVQTSDWSKVWRAELDYISFVDMQVDAATANGDGIEIVAATSMAASKRIIINCYIRNSSGAASASQADGIKQSDNTTTEIINNIVEGFGRGMRLALDYSTAYDVLIANNTIIGSTDIGLNALPQSGATFVSRNNIVVGSTGSDFDTANVDHDYDISSDATATGSNSLINQVSTDLMTDPSVGDFTLKTGSNAIGAGTDLSAYFTTDITGATRTVPWDIGAFAYIAASTVPTLSAPSFVGRIPSTTLAF